MLSERSQTGKATISMTPFSWHCGKGKTEEQKDQQLAGLQFGQELPTKGSFWSN